MNFEVFFSDEFLIDIKKHQKTGNKSVLKKIDTLLTEIRIDPKIGTGKPEQLKYFKEIIWSRRINSQHRLIYEIKATSVEILSGWGHYDDK